jgi:hypothetical protein
MPGLAAAHQAVGLPLRAARPDVSQAAPPRARRRRAEALKPRRAQCPRQPGHRRPVEGRPRASDPRRRGLPRCRRQLAAAKTGGSHLTSSVQRNRWSGRGDRRSCYGPAFGTPAVPGSGCQPSRLARIEGCPRAARLRRVHRGSR